MPTLRKYKVFISHAWDYDPDYWRVVRFLNDAPFFEWENTSVPQHDPIKSPHLEYHLRKRMRGSDIFLIVSGMYAAHRDWIEFEVDFARRIGLPVVGITKWGGERIPLIIQRGTREQVGWNGASIVTAVRRHAKPSGPTPTARSSVPSPASTPHGIARRQADLPSAGQRNYLPTLADMLYKGPAASGGIARGDSGITVQDIANEHGIVRDDRQTAIARAVAALARRGTSFE